jgi:DNA end-binding protein Ku
MAMRSIWKGAITFLLVSIPVKIYNAIESSEKISFNQLHAGECLGPVGQKKQCKKCDAVVNNDEITKGYQHEPDQYVIITSEEIGTITPASNESIDIIGFIDPTEIPTTYFDASYFVAPNGPSAGKPYALLREVMKRTRKVGVGKVILREREELVTISPNADGLMIQKLHYRHEVRDINNVPGVTGLATTEENELQLAEALVDKLITTFDEIDTVDHYHVALKQMLETKVAGGTIDSKAQTTKAAPAIDIMAALQASLNATPKPKTEANAQPTLTLVPPAEEKQTRKRRTG